jgi:Aerotolerance regulator N-terminal/von Willebrand factor type A domain
MTTLSAITLLSPAMLAGLGLVALPIAAHLLHRRARRRVVFPSVELLALSAASQSSLFKLRRLLLLLLRCLAVAAVALAFAQPLWRSAGAADTRNKPRAAVVLLVDSSASTAQQYRGVSAIHALRAKADRTLDALLTGEDFTNIVYATSRPYAAFPSMTANLDAVRAELAALAPTAERADLTGALALAGRMLAEQQGPRRLVILTDLQASNWQDALGRLASEKPIPDGTRVTILPLDSPPPANLALHEPTAYPHTPLIGRPTRLTVKLTNHSDQLQATTVQMHLDGRLIDSQSLTIEPRQQREVSFTTKLDRPETYRVVFSIPGDGLPGDDRSALAVRAVERTPVVVITDDAPGFDSTPGSNAPPGFRGSAGYFMLRALAPHGDSRDRFDAQTIRSDQAAWPDLQRAAAVFVGEVGTLPEPLLAALHRYMDRGGGVVFFCGGGPVASNLAALDALAPEGMLPWTPTSLRNPEAMGDTLTITGGDWRSPWLRRFDEAGRLALSQIQVGRLWSGGAVDERAHLLLMFSDGTPALAWRGVGAGRLVLVNLSPQPSYSDLGKHGLFVALMQGLADDVQPARAHRQAGVVGRAVTFSPWTAINPKGPAPTVVCPDGQPADDAAFSLDDQGSLIAINYPKTPGFYTAMQGGTVLGVVPVNTDPRESDLRRVLGDDLQAALRTPGVQAEVRHAAAGAALNLHGRALWGWALAGALALLGIEMAVLGTLKR